MHANTLLLLGAIVAAGSISYSAPARAGDLSAAALSCTVITRRTAPMRAQFCGANWTPDLGNARTTARFMVTGATAGNYGYVWLNLETNLAPTGCGNLGACTVPIATDTLGDGEAHLQVTVTDLDTGVVRTLDARAMYLDVYH